MSHTVDVAPEPGRSPDAVIAERIVAEFREQGLIADKFASHLLVRLANGQMAQESWQRLAELVDEEERHAQKN